MSRRSGQEPKVELSASGKIWLGLGTSLVGALAIALPFLMLSGAQSEHDAKVHEQSFKQTSCIVTASRMTDVQTNDGVAHVLQVDFTMQVEGQTFDQLSYTYATHTSPGAVIPPGRNVPCFYDPSSPTSVVLIQKSAPTGERPGVGVLQVFFIALGALTLVYGVYILRTKRRLHLGDVPDYR